MIRLYARPTLLLAAAVAAACAERPAKVVEQAPVESASTTPDASTSSDDRPDATPELAATTAPALPPASSDAGAAPPAGQPAQAPIVLDVSFVSISVSHASLRIDGGRHGVFRSTLDAMSPNPGEETIVEGTVSEATMARLADTLKRSRFCSIKLPSDEPMVWTGIQVDLPNAKCNLRMSPSAWHKRHPEVIRVIHAIEREVCPSGCPRSSSFD